MYWITLGLRLLPLVRAITPEQMIETPMRSVLTPNPSGEWGIFASTTYSLENQETKVAWNLMDLTTGDAQLLSDDPTISEISWVGRVRSNSAAILYVNATNETGDGGVSLYYADVFAMDDATLISPLSAPFSGLQASVTEAGDIHFLMQCLAYENGTAYNPVPVSKPVSSARVYNSLWPRHWDFWLDDTRQNIFSGRLVADNGTYKFDGAMENRQVGLANVNRAETPDRPVGGLADYAVSPDGETIAFVTRNIDLPLANHTQSVIYLAPFNGSRAPEVLNPYDSTNTPGIPRGYSASPVFSPNSQYVAYFQMDTDGYEADRNKLYVAKASLTDPEIATVSPNWDRSPTLLKWASDGQSVFVAAPDRAQLRIFEIPLNSTHDLEPVNITNQGTVEEFAVLPDGNILVSDSKIWSSRDFYIVSPKGLTVVDLFHANEQDPNLEGLNPDDVSEFYYQGNFSEIHAFVIYPSGFDQSHSYPLAYILHGGPQSAHFNAWSTRLNLKVWADQGYIVVAPNPTGSISFGQDLTDAISNEWGGYPYDDLVKCWEYVDKNLDFVDTKNGIAGGASYGGFMTNWIQGHELGRKFKTLVTNDGITNTLNQWATDELFFTTHEFNGTLWEGRRNYEKFNPIDHIHNWETPHLVMHNTLDYRVPESEGLMLFNILQTKGVPSKFINFPDENHGSLSPENSEVWHSETFRWINYWSGLSKEDPW